MVWEQHTLVIVMTTRVLERGRVKCGQYWEVEPDHECEYGQFRIRTLSVDTNEDYTVTSLELTNLKVKPRQTFHFMFQVIFFFTFFVYFIISNVRGRLMNYELYHIGNSQVGRIMVYRRRPWQC